MSHRTSQLNVDPGLHVKGVGNIRLPLDEKDAISIMEVAHQTPFGRGSHTVVDTSFRDTKQLDVDAFQLRNPAWTGHLHDVVRHLGERLGLPANDAGVTPELHKLLLYKEGAMFKSHKE